MKEHETVQEFQGLVNDILADKIIEPQEVRQLKAWLMAHRQNPDDFAAMFKVIDESLVDGIIDTDETQAIYEGIIDCLITLRERRWLVLAVTFIGCQFQMIFPLVRWRGCLV